MAIVLLDESALNEDAGSNYVVKRLIIDVAARDEDHADKLNNSAGAGDHSVFDALSDALKSCGYEMAGDQCIVDGDFSDVYKNNGYEFFTECSMNEGNESDEYKSYKDQWEKNYKGKNKPQKDVDAFIQSAWNDLNNGENRFTGDEFKKLCADAGVDHKKFIESLEVGHKKLVVRKSVNESSLMEVDYSKWTQEKEDKNIDVVKEELISAGYKVRKRVTTGTGYPQVYFKVQDELGKVVTVSQNMSGPMRSWRYLSWTVSITINDTKKSEWYKSIDLPEYDTAEGLVDLVKKAFDYQGVSPDVMTYRMSTKYLLQSLSNIYGKDYLDYDDDQFSIVKDFEDLGDGKCNYTRIQIGPFIYNNIQVATWNGDKGKWINYDNIEVDPDGYGVTHDDKGRCTKEYLDKLIDKLQEIIPKSSAVHLSKWKRGYSG